MSDTYSNETTHEIASLQPAISEDLNNEVNAGGGRQKKIFSLPVEIAVSIGSARMSFEEVLGLETSDVIDLSSKVTDPVELLVGDRKIAIGELVESDSVDGSLCVRILEVCSHED